MVFCSFVAAAGVLFPVKWMFQFGQIAPVKLSDVACIAIPNGYTEPTFLRQVRLGQNKLQATLCQELSDQKGI
jgi:hypothetical protein